jgi:A/G-specific adenine glycosylase
VQQTLIDWFDQNKRDLPWRNTTPWGVMVSEFMLQQTPVKRVLPVWEQWLAQWPTPADLAAAKRSEVITAWGRLGYPRRAIRLHESAKVISEQFNNEVPRTVEELRELPGIGEYTSAAICAFAFNQPTLVLDVNIRRLFARYYDGVETPSTSPSQYERKIRYELIPDLGAQWAAATMEFGALICTARNPACDSCPMASSCAWREAGYLASKIAKKSQAWAGTDRQCRGVVLQALREKKTLTRSKLLVLWHSDKQLDKALKTLLADGLIETTGKSYKLAD